MIRSSEEFVALLEQSDRRAQTEDAPVAVWMDVIQSHAELREWVAQNKTIPADVIRVLANDESSGVRIVVAMKRSCPPEILRQLANDPAESVRARVAYNPVTSAGTLAILEDDPSPLVQEALAARVQNRAAS